MHNIPGQIGKILMADSEPLEDTDIMIQKSTKP